MGASGCVPLTTQVQEDISKTAVSKHSSPVGSASCVPLTSQTHVVELNTAVW